MNNVRPILADWPNQRCKPNIMPFAGLINSKSGQSIFDYTADNFAHCIQSISSQTYQYIQLPFYYTLHTLTHVFTDLEDSIQSMRAMFNNIRKNTQSFSEDVMGRQLNTALPLVGSFFFALFNIVTPKLREDPSETTLLYTCGAGALLTTIGAPWVWQWPSFNEWLIILGFGALGALAHLGVVRSFMNADVSTLAPLNYTRLIWALGLGWILFSQWPDTLALVGGAIIVASGLYVVINAARGN